MYHLIKNLRRIAEAWRDGAEELERYNYKPSDYAAELRAALPQYAESKVPVSEEIVCRLASIYGAKSPVKTNGVWAAHFNDQSRDGRTNMRAFDFAKAMYELGFYVSVVCEDYVSVEWR